MLFSGPFMSRDVLRSHWSCLAGHTGSPDLYLLRSLSVTSNLVIVFDVSRSLSVASFGHFSVTSVSHYLWRHLVIVCEQRSEILAFPIISVPFCLYGNMGETHERLQAYIQARTHKYTNVTQMDTYNRTNRNTQSQKDTHTITEHTYTNKYTCINVLSDSIIHAIWYLRTSNCLW